MRHVGIIMSAGKGLRVGGDIPKQYMELCGKPVLYYSIKAMQDSFIDEIIIVCGAGDEEYVRENIVNKYSLDKVRRIVEGGAERSDSVFNGLRAVLEPEKAYVYIHDGARPMLNNELLLAVREDVECFGTAVLGVNSKDTVKLVDENGFVSATPDRAFVWNIQTPQAFKGDDIIAAYEAFRERKNVKVTDDASVMECFGKLPVHITKGDYCNIKITTSEDFLTATNFLKKVEKSS